MIIFKKHQHTNLYLMVGYSLRTGVPVHTESIISREVKPKK